MGAAVGAGRRLSVAAAPAATVRRLLFPAALAAAGALALAANGLLGFAWTDYELSALGPVRALLGGHWSAFAAAAPPEGPSLLLRAPFALLAHALGGGDLAVYRALAVPCLLAGAGLGVVLWAGRVRAFPSARWPWLVVVLAAANPVTLRALDMGHPEELLGAALCTGAVLAALADRPWLAAVLLGLALADKAWAVLAVGPVLLALPRRRAAALGLAVALGALAVAPFLLAAGGSGAVGGATHTFGVFQPWQVWWFLGEHGAAVTGFFGIPHPGYRTAPGWIGPLTHPLIAGLVVPASVVWWRRRGLADRSGDVLALLAALLLARCVLDPADNVYYHLPFLLALLAWEARASARPPVATLAATAAVWASFEWLPQVLAPDAQAAAYLLWALPALAAMLAVALRVTNVCETIVTPGPAAVPGPA